MSVWSSDGCSSEVVGGLAESIEQGCHGHGCFGGGCTGTCRGFGMRLIGSAAEQCAQRVEGLEVGVGELAVSGGIGQDVVEGDVEETGQDGDQQSGAGPAEGRTLALEDRVGEQLREDRKSTRLNYSH